VSYEDDVRNNYDKKQHKAHRLEMGFIRYFWEASPLSRRGEGIPKFLKKIKALKNFSDNELRILTKYIHRRTFKSGECIFERGEKGFGFYYILSGQVDLYLNDKEMNDNHVNLKKYDHFGELALLQENSLRTVSAYSKSFTVLLGIFKPDLNDLISNDPTIAAKFLQSISWILANRLEVMGHDLLLLKKNNHEDPN
jgi:CRP/FNR family transcriptional regulator, cyclic AMP receptor protein